MVSRKTTPPKRTKAVVEPKRSTADVVKVLRTGLKDLRAELLRALDQVKVELLTDAFNGRGRLGESLDPMVAQLAGINRMLREKTQNERFVRHGRVVTFANFGEEIERIERAGDEKYEAALAITRAKDDENARLRAENDRLRADLKKVAAAFPEAARSGRQKAKRAAGAKPAKEAAEAPSPPFIRQYEIS
jgi:hypothetical protein